MKEINIQIKLLVYDDEKDLPALDRQLLERATLALKNSYSPYSNFKVGAAILLDNGKIVMGSNQENAAYSMCICAERVALSVVAAEHPNCKVKKIAVTAWNERNPVRKPVSPCGACRQTLSEVEFRQKEPFEVIMRGQEGQIYIVGAANDLLPFTFDPTFL